MYIHTIAIIILGMRWIEPIRTRCGNIIDAQILPFVDNGIGQSIVRCANDARSHITSGSTLLPENCKRRRHAEIPVVARDEQLLRPNPEEPPKPRGWMRSECTVSYKTRGLGGGGRLDVDTTSTFRRRRHVGPCVCHSRREPPLELIFLELLEGGTRHLARVFLVRLEKRWRHKK